MNHKPLISAALALGFLALPALAQEAEGRPAAKARQMLPYIEKLMAMPEAERDYIAVKYRFLFKGKPVRTGDIWLFENGQRIDIPLDSEGHVDWQAIKAYLPDNPTIYTRLEKGGGQVSINLEPELPPSKDILVADIHRAMQQANTAIRKQAGMLSIMAPQMKGISFELAPATRAEWHKPDGSVTALVVDPKTNRLSFKPKSKDAGSLVFSAPPKSDGFID